MTTPREHHLSVRVTPYARRVIGTLALETGMSEAQWIEVAARTFLKGRIEGRLKEIHELGVAPPERGNVNHRPSGEKIRAAKKQPPAPRGDATEIPIPPVEDPPIRGTVTTTPTEEKAEAQVQLEAAETVHEIPGPAAAAAPPAEPEPVVRYGWDEDAPGWIRELDERLDAGETLPKAEHALLARWMRGHEVEKP